MKKNKLLTLFLLIVLLIPAFVNGKDSEYKVGKAQVTELTSDFAYQFERYEELLGINDKYIYMLLSTEKIQKLDHDFKVISESETGMFELENTIYRNDSFYTVTNIYFEEQQKNEISIVKYDNNFKKISTLNLTKEIGANISSCKNFEYYNNQFYLLCDIQNSVDNTYSNKQLIFNEKEIIYNVEPEFNQNGYYDIYELKDGLYYFSAEEKSIFKITEKGEHISVKDLSDIWDNNDYYHYFKNMVQDSNGNILFIYTKDGRFHQIEAIVFDKDFKVTKEKSIDVEDYIGETVVATDNHYVFVNKYTTGYYSKSVDQEIRLYWFDKNLEFIDYVDYENDLFKENPKNEEYASPNKYKYINNIYKYNDSIYVSAKIGYISYSPVDANILVRFDLNQYQIKTEIISGKGDIKPNVEIEIEGNEVTYKVKPAIGYRLKELYVITESNKKIEIKDNKFTMPAENVIIKAEFELIPIIEDIKNPETIGGISIGIIIALILSISLIIINKRKRKA